MAFPLLWDAQLERLSNSYRFIMIQATLEVLQLISLRGSFMNYYKKLNEMRALLLVVAFVIFLLMYFWKS